MRHGGLETLLRPLAMHSYLLANQLAAEPYRGREGRREGGGAGDGPRLRLAPGLGCHGGEHESDWLYPLHTRGSGSFYAIFGRGSEARPSRPAHQEGASAVRGGTWGSSKSSEPPGRVWSTAKMLDRAGHLIGPKLPAAE